MRLWFLLVAGIASSVQADPLCVDCLSIRVHRPVVVRGPDNLIPDSPLAVAPLPDGTIRAFLNGFKIDAPMMWSLSGPRTQVLPPGSGYPDNCGRWITSVQQFGSTLRGFVHGEYAQNCQQGGHHWSESYATSNDNGQTWQMQGVILDYGAPDPNQQVVTGEGNFTVIDGHDGFYYAYGQHMGPGSDGHIVVARAPAGDPGPGTWWKWCNGDWQCSGNWGESDSINEWGKAASTWVNTGATMLLAEDLWDGWGHGIRSVWSTDHVNFQHLNEPLLYLEGNTWSRPDPTELYGYSQALSEAGKPEWSNYFVLSQLWVPPGADFSSRYLVLRDVSVTLLSAPYRPQVGVAMSRWFSPVQKDHWSTTGPVPDPSYAFEGTRGYMMTAPPDQPSVQLEECVSNWVGHPDHIVWQSGRCAQTGYTHLRTAGWAYRDPQPNTLPIYRCWNPTLQCHFVSNQSDCEGMGRNDELLGYVLAN